MNKNYLLWIIAGLVVAAAVVYAVMMNAPAEPVENTQDPEQVFCTMEAKLCPDGSYVGRSGPNCEFDPCPGTYPTPAPLPSGN